MTNLLMSDNALIEKMLGLPEFEVTDFKQNDNDMGFYVQTKERPTTCPACGCFIPELVIYKSRAQTVRDINALGKRSALIIKRRYYECRECGGYFVHVGENIVLLHGFVEKTRKIPDREIEIANKYLEDYQRRNET